MEFLEVRIDGGAANKMHFLDQAVKMGFNPTVSA
jgi:hypothetical protein